jgi:hypothetical protein
MTAKIAATLIEDAPAGQAEPATTGSIPLPTSAKAAGK